MFYSPLNAHLLTFLVLGTTQSLRSEFIASLCGILTSKSIIELSDEVRLVFGQVLEILRAVLASARPSDALLNVLRTNSYFCL